jgi:hypothetical protein
MKQTGKGMKQRRKAMTQSLSSRGDGFTIAISNAEF